ncbi:SPX domain-containing protein [Fennellomyces sp. T-0311]|nr:SPX domain-containing protein [Fennellomyces sp. T-0311]
MNANMKQETLRQQDTDFGYSKMNPLYWLPQHHRSAIMSKAPEANLSHLPIPLRYAKNDNLSYQVARGRLKKALTEFYRNLEYLKSYKEVNLLGFQSILKKYDKVARWQASRLYMEKVKQCHWVSSKDLDKVTEETIRLFSNEFAEGNRTRGERCLKRTEKEQAVRISRTMHFIILNMATCRVSQLLPGALASILAQQSSFCFTISTWL